MTVRYITLCSGIECVSLAAVPLGWEPVCFSEIEVPLGCAGPSLPERPQRR